jgi:hypothetical protein
MTLGHKQAATQDRLSESLSIYLDPRLRAQRKSNAPDGALLLLGLTCDKVRAARLRPVGDEFDVDVAARRVAIGADLLVRLFRQGLQLRLG